MKRPDRRSSAECGGGVQLLRRWDKPVYLMLVPTASEILGDVLPANAPTWDQHNMIQKIYHKLDKENKNLVYLDAYMPLYNSKNQYIYYRTDHHWTTLGAFDTYYLTGKKMGFQPYSMEVFDIEHASYDFMGSLFSKTLFGHVKPDVIDLYHYNKKDVVEQVEVDTGKEVLEYPSLYFREFLEKKDKYSVFTGQNQPLITIHQCGRQKAAAVQDSYAHAMVPFWRCTMSDHHSGSAVFPTSIPKSERWRLRSSTDPLQCPNFAQDASVRKLPRRPLDYGYRDTVFEIITKARRTAVRRAFVMISPG
ncbi:MAG: DHHW family protein [Oscillospiraceae bacterium]